MADATLNVLVEGKDHLSPVLKTAESGIIRLVGAVSALTAAFATMALPVTLAADFQKAMLDVKRTTDFSADSIKYLSDALVEMSRHTDTTAKELARIAGLGGQLGLGDMGAEGILRFTESIARAVTVLDVSADEAANSMGKLRTIFDIPADQFDNSLAVITKMANASTASAEELFDVMRRIGNLGGSVNFAQAAALSATMIDIGFTPETSGTTLSKIFANMKSEATEFARFMNVSVGEWISLVNKDGIGALHAYLQQLNKMPTEVAASTKRLLTGGGRIFEAVSKLQIQEKMAGGGIVDKHIAAATREMALGTAAIQGQQSVLSGLSKQWDVFVNNLKATGIAIGNRALYPLTQMLERMSKSLQDPAFIDGIVNFARDAIESIKSVVAGLQSISKAISSLSSVEDSPKWGHIFDIATLFMTVAAIKGAIATIRVLGSGTAAIFTLGKKPSAGAGTHVYPSGGAEEVGWLERKRRALLGVVATREAEIVAIRQARSEAELSAMEQERLAARARTTAALAAAAKTAADDAAAAKAAAVHRQTTAVAAMGGGNAAWDARLAARLAANARILAEEGALAENLRRKESSLADQKIAINNALAVKKAQLSQTEYAAAAARAEKDIARAEALSARNIAAAVKESAARVAIIEAEIASIAALRTNQSARYAIYAARDANIDVAIATKRLDTAKAEAAAAQEVATKAASATAPSNTALPLLAGGAALVASKTLKESIVGVGTAIAGKTTAVIASARALGLWASGAKVAATAIGLVGKAVGLLIPGLNLLFMAWLLFDLGKIVAGWLGWDKPIVDGLNKVIKGFNSLTGLNVPTIGTEASMANAARDAEKLAEELSKAKALAEGFNKTFGEISTGEGVSKFTESLADTIVNIREAREEAAKGLKFSFTSEDTPLTMLQSTVTSLEKVEAKVGEVQQSYEAMGRAIAKNIADEEDARAKAYALRIKPASKFTREDEKNATIQEETATRLVAERAVLREKENMDLRAANALRKEANALAGDFASVLSKSTFEKLVGDPGKGNGQLTQLRDLNDEIKKYEATVTNLKSKQGSVDASSSEYAALEQQLREVNNLLAQSQAKRAAIRTAATGDSELKKTIPLEQDRLRLLGQLITSKQALNRLDAYNATAGSSNAQGLGSLAQMPVSTYSQGVAMLSLATAAKKAYTSVALAAKEAAEAAQKYVTTSVQESVDRMRSLQTYATALQVSLAKHKQDAAQTGKDREVDKATAWKLLALDQEKRKQEDILDNLVSQGRMTREVAEQRKLMLQQDMQWRYDYVNDGAGAEKAKNRLAALNKTFDEEARLAEAHARRMVELETTMKDTALPAQTRAAAAEEWRREKDALTATLDKTKELGKEIMALPPSGKVEIVKQSDIERIMKATTYLEQMRALRTEQGATPASNAMGTYASGADEMVTAWEAAEKKILAQIQNIASAAGGITLGKLAIDVDTATAAPALQAELAKLKALGAASPINVAVTPTLVGNIEQELEAIRVKAGASLKGMTISAQPSEASLTVAQQKIAEYLGTVTTKVSANVDKDGIQKQLSSKKFSIDIEGKISGVTGGSSTGAAMKADGGPIVGPGTSRSDDVPIWASNGEWMMDATTVRAFGGSFMRNMQSFAKSGNPMGFLRQITPQFANGGPINPQMVRSLRGAVASRYDVQRVSNDGGGKALEVTELSLVFNSKPVGRVTGSRDSIHNLVSALTDISRGT